MNIIKESDFRKEIKAKPQKRARVAVNAVGVARGKT